MRRLFSWFVDLVDWSDGWTAEGEPWVTNLVSEEEVNDNAVKLGRATPKAITRNHRKRARYCKTKSSFSESIYDLQ